jgi:hypothetical protein
LEWVRNPRAVEDLIGYLEKRREFIPDYQERRRAGSWMASTLVEKFNDWAVSGRCKYQGMSWTPQGVLALAVLEAARCNGELDHWRQDRELPERNGACDPRCRAQGLGSFLRFSRSMAFKLAFKAKAVAHRPRHSNNRRNGARDEACYV